MNSKNSQTNDYNVGCSVNTLILLVLVVIIGLVYYYIRIVSNRPTPIELKVELISCDDSLNYKLDSASIAKLDETISLLNKQEHVYEDRYRYFLETKELSNDIFVIGGGLLGIIASILAFFGFKSFKEIEEKAQGVAKSEAREVIEKSRDEVKKVVDQGKDDAKEEAKKGIEDVLNDAKEKLSQQVTESSKKINTIKEETISNINSSIDPIKQKIHDDLVNLLSKDNNLMFEAKSNEFLKKWIEKEDAKKIIKERIEEYLNDRTSRFLSESDLNEIDESIDELDRRIVRTNERIDSL